MVEYSECFPETLSKEKVVKYVFRVLRTEFWKVTHSSWYMEYFSVFVF